MLNSIIIIIFYPGYSIIKYNSFSEAQSLYFIYAASRLI